MANLFGLASVGQFLQGFARGRAAKAAQEAQEKQERIGRLSSVLQAAGMFQKMAQDPTYSQEKREEFARKGTHLFQGAVDLLGTIDEKPKKRGNPILGFMSSLIGIGGKPDPAPFNQKLSEMLHSAGGDPAEVQSGASSGPALSQDQGVPRSSAPTGHGGAGNVSAPAVREKRAPGLSAVMGSATGEGRLAGVITPETPAPSASTTAVASGERFLRDPKAEQAAKIQAVRRAFAGVNRYLKQNNITTREGLMRDPRGRQIVNDLNLLAQSSGFEFFDEPDEVFAALGLQPAPRPQDQFTDRLFSLRSKLARGTISEAEAAELMRMEKMKRGPSKLEQTVEDLKNVARMSDAEARQYAARIATGQGRIAKIVETEQGQVPYDVYGNRILGADGRPLIFPRKPQAATRFALRTIRDPNSGRPVLARVNPQTGEVISTGVEVPSTFRVSQLMDTNMTTGEQRISGRKAILLHKMGLLSTDALKKVFEAMPDTYAIPGSEVATDESGLQINQGKRALGDYLRELRRGRGDVDNPFR